jgi:hypothetical protein
MGDPTALFETPQKSPEPAIWTLPLLVGAKDRNLLGESVNLTFMTAAGAYSFTTTIGPAQP